MVQEAWETLLAEAEQTRSAAIAAAEEEYRRVVEAVALLRTLRRAKGPERLSHGRLLAVVKAAIDELDGSFTVRDVETRLQDLAPDVAGRVASASISTTLRRLVDKRRLDLAEPGSSTRPAKYRKAS